MSLYVRRISKVFGLLMLAGVAVILLLSLSTQPHLTALPPNVTADKIVIDKAAHLLTLYANGEALRSYPVSFGRGGLAPKQREGDKLTPEGQYKILNRKADSAYHRALRISYPDEADKKRAAAAGVSAGSDIMIHGLRNGLGWLGTLHRRMDWTLGCIAVTNPEIEEIWALIPDGTPVVIQGAAVSTSRIETKEG
jgi:murein L,D-transpeptidase YafK